MKDFLRNRLDKAVQRLAELDFLLSRPDILADMKQFMALSREHADVAQLATRYQRYRQIEADLAAARALRAEAADDADMRQMVDDEIASIQAEAERLQAVLQRMLLPRDANDERAAFVEIRAGTGGDESALFAADLLRMYSRFADAQGWRTELMNESASELGGYKEVVVRVEGRSDHGGVAVGAYGWLRFESGGHRVQRVPVTETQGRIHTSACTVAVMPEPDEAAVVQINPSELRIDTFRASGAGGQHINKTDSAVRITHLPTGIVAECQDGRSQHSNKAQALRVLSARIDEKHRRERAAQEASLRKGLVGSGDRSDRIRTYNFPQGRVTDHRINLTLYKLGQVMEGELHELLAALLAEREAEQLAQLQAD